MKKKKKKTLMSENFMNKRGDQYEFCKQKPNPFSSHVTIQGCSVTDKDEFDMLY